MTPRNLADAEIGKCLYVPIVDEDAGLINDPVLLVLDENKFWLSIADSDVLLYAKGLALGAGLNVRVSEPDVSPLAIQGPKAESLLVELFGKHLKHIPFFGFDWIDFAGTRQLIARSGYSRQGGFEIYLNGGHLGGALWDLIWEAGQAYNIAPGCPNLIERIEGGLLSYGNEMTRENNPLEIGLDKYCSLDRPVDCLGWTALKAIATQGVQRQIRGVLFDGDPCPTCSQPWPVLSEGEKIGQITSAIWSPRLKRNVGLSLIDQVCLQFGRAISVHSSDDQIRDGEISQLPFA